MANGARHQRQRLLNVLDQLPIPEAAAFKSVAAPPSFELASYRLIDDRAVRAELVSAHLIEIVQRPGPGNWKKTKPPAYIAKVYPNFDAPANSGPSRGPRKRTAFNGGEDRVAGAVAQELRDKWESYFVDTRPEQQRRHAERAQHVEPSAISSRATQLIAEARRKNRPLLVRDAMLLATDELTADFETSMRRKYGDLIVDVLGIPDSPDSRDK